MDTSRPSLRTNWTRLVPLQVGGVDEQQELLGRGGERGGQGAVAARDAARAGLRGRGGGAGRPGARAAPARPRGRLRNLRVRVLGAARAALPLPQVRAAPPPPSRTNWTRLVPLPVLTGRVSSLFTQVRAARVPQMQRRDRPRRARDAGRAPPTRCGRWRRALRNGTPTGLVLFVPVWRRQTPVSPVLPEQKAHSADTNGGAAPAAAAAEHTRVPPRRWSPGRASSQRPTTSAMTRLTPAPPRLVLSGHAASLTPY